MSVCICISCSCLLLFIYLFINLFFFFAGNSQIKWLVDIFRAKIVDISEHSVTIEVIAGHIWIMFSSLIVMF